MWKIAEWWLLILLALLLGISTHAQVIVEDERLLGKPISKMLIMGNEVTAEEIILREMKTEVGDIADSQKLEADLLRIQSLGLFSRVEFLLCADSAAAALTIKVTEEWYIFPFPFWRLTEDSPPRLIYGFRYLQENFRGRNETLSISLWNGADRGFKLAHRTPWMKGTTSWSRSISLYQTALISKRIAFEGKDLEERHTGVGIFVGKRWLIELNSEWGVKFRLVEADSAAQLATNGVLDRILEAHTQLLWDSRDLRQFPMRGFYAGCRFQYGWILNGTQRYYHGELDLRGYQALTRNLSICSRLFWQPSSEHIPPYDWNIIRNSNPIRSAHLHDEGKSLFLGTIEARIHLLQLRYFSWEAAPLAKRYFTNLQFGLAGALFFDFGDVYNRPEELTEDVLKLGYGVGLLFRIPYLEVLRLELSWNPEYSYEDVEFSWKIGTSF
ncbi:MAG: BamA/TamA family outer membrane protein [bacterium]